METADFNVTRVNYVIHRRPTASWTMDKVCYEREYIVVLALEGKAFYSFDGEEIAAEKNGVFVFPPGRPRSAWADSENPWEFISVNFMLDANSEGKKFFDKTIVKRDGEKLRSSFLEIARCWTGKNPLYQVKCKNLVSEILYEILSGQTSGNSVPHMRRLEAAQKFIQENFRKKITAAEIAETAGLSGSYFRKIFKDAFGDAPMNYITKLRISAARDLLVSGEANVTETAEICGFDDIYYFSTIFKQHTGMSPTQFIKAHNER